MPGEGQIPIHVLELPQWQTTPAFRTRLKACHVMTRADAPCRGARRARQGETGSRAAQAFRAGVGMKSTVKKTAVLPNYASSQQPFREHFEPIERFE